MKKITHWPELYDQKIRNQIDIQAVSGANNITILQKEILICNKCTDLSRTRSKIVTGTGDENALVFFVGLAPGRLGADQTGIPFTQDRSGRLLRRMIEHIGLESFYITNLVKCNPKDKCGRNRNPTLAEIRNCSNFLDREVKLINPIIVAPLGATATKFFLRNSKNLKFSEIKSLEFERDGRVVIPFYHPGFVIRGLYSEKNYIQDFERLKANTLTEADKINLEKSH